MKNREENRMPNTSRRCFIKLMGFAGIMPSALLRCRPRTGKPNIVVIMADDLGYGDLSCYGNKTINTPHLDALAEQGLKFTDYHANGAVCTPTRAALLTGRYQQRCGMEGVIYARGETRQTGMAPEDITFADVLKSAGYRTAVCGKWHLGYREKYNPVHQGFDEFYGYVSGNVDYISHIDGAGIHDWWHHTQKVKVEGYTTDLITNHAVDFINRHKNSPFCLYVAHESPHYPFQGREDDAVRRAGSAPRQEISLEGKKRAYKEMVQVMDEGIGRIVSTLKTAGLDQNTFIFFCSDNGAIKNVGSNGVLRGAKGSLWEGGHRVPAIACWPGHISAGRTTAETALSMDILPTLLSITGAALNTPALDGIDLSPVLFDNAKLPNRYLYWRYRKQKVARKGKWKLIVDNNTPHLFDLENDIAEQKDRIKEKPDIVKEQLKKLDLWEKDMGSPETMITI